MSAQPRKPVRRIVTGHDPSGRATIRFDENLTSTRIPRGDAEFTLVWTTPTVPADNNDETDGATRAAGLTLHGGSVIRVVDLGPGEASPMHRSSSIDYGIVLSGELELELERGDTTRLGSAQATSWFSAAPITSGATQAQRNGAASSSS